MLGMLDRGSAQFMLGLAALGIAVCGAGGVLWGADQRGWAIALFVIGGLLILVSIVGLVYLLLHNDHQERSEAARPISAKADNQSIAQAAGGDAINIGSIVNQATEPATLLPHPETKGFQDGGVWWEFDRYVWAGAPVPSVRPYCPEHHDYELHYRARFPGGDRGRLERLHRTHRGGFIVCPYGGEHDVPLAKGTRLDDVWSRAEANIAAQIKEWERGQGEAGVFFVGGPED